MRTEEVEEVLALSGEPLSLFFRAYNAITNADVVFKDAFDEKGATKEVGQSSIDSLITEPDRNVRKTSYENYAQGYIDFKIHSCASNRRHITRYFNARSRLSLLL